jgi:hypothetical protein
MAYFQQDVLINVAAATAWDALRDVGNLHTRLVRGFVIECHFDGQTRHLKFANGITTAERIVAIHDANKRVSWAANSERLTHHNASAQVFAVGPNSCKIVWTVDLLPDSMEPAIAAMVNDGLQAMKATLQSNSAGSSSL